MHTKTYENLLQIWQRRSCFIIKSFSPNLLHAWVATWDEILEKMDEHFDKERKKA